MTPSKSFRASVSESPPFKGQGTCRVDSCCHFEVVVNQIQVEGFLLPYFLTCGSKMVRASSCAEAKARGTCETSHDLSYVQSHPVSTSPSCAMMAKFCSPFVFLSKIWVVRISSRSYTTEPSQILYQSRSVNHWHIDFSTCDTRASLHVPSIRCK